MKNKWKSSDVRTPISTPRRVKIICTLGPSSSQRIGELHDAGMDVARLNFSHGDHAYHRNLFQIIRSIEQKQNRIIGILQDLQGPKLRVGSLGKEGVKLEAGNEVLLYPEGKSPKISSQGKKIIPVSAEIAEAIAKDVSKGAQILFDDGRILTEVKQVRGSEMVVEVKNGGTLLSQKGMNLPDTPLSLSCLTEKDLKDLKLGLELGVDAIALSFVRSAKDIEELQKRIKKQSNRSPEIIAKMERKEAIEEQESILEVSDGLLIARGDMAVELGVERVPIIQKQLIHASNELGVPVITATQMLESMIQSPAPTRAEATDVANAVFDGTDAVMLSAETASGQYPLEAVRTMAQIVSQAETEAESYSVHEPAQPTPGVIVESIEYSAAKVAYHVGASLVVCLTQSGVAARVLSKYRPVTPVLALTDREEVIRRLSWVWGVQGVLMEKMVPTDDLFGEIEDLLKTKKLVKNGDLIVITAGIPTLKRGTTNMIKVHRVGATGERQTGAQRL